LNYATGFILIQPFTDALRKLLEDNGRAEVRRSTEFHAQTSSARDEELGGGVVI